jgi:hypothetical protein
VANIQVLPIISNQKYRPSGKVHSSIVLLMEVDAADGDRQYKENSQKLFHHLLFIKDMFNRLVLFPK